MGKSSWFSGIEWKMVLVKKKIGQWFPALVFGLWPPLKNEEGVGVYDILSDLVIVKIIGYRETIGVFVCDFFIKKLLFLLKN